MKYLKKTVLSSGPWFLDKTHSKKLSSLSHLRFANGSKKDLLEKIPDANVLLHNSDIKLTKEIINHAPNLQGIVFLSVGYDGIDLNAVSEKGISVSHTPGANSIAVAEFTFNLLLNLVRQTHIISQKTQASQSWESIWKEHVGTELNNKTIGIIGFGEIGRKVGNIAHAFGMKILVYDPYINLQSSEFKFTDLHSLIKTCDVITIHVPLNNDTQNLLGKTELNLMKKNSLLINASRGNIIDEESLITLLKEKKISAALDVFSKEPLPSKNEFIKLDNVILTPHIAWNTYEAIENTNKVAIDEIILILKNQFPKYTINKNLLCKYGYDITE